MRQIMGRWVFDRLEELVDPRWTAALVVDMQNDFCLRDGYLGSLGLDVEPIARLIKPLAEFLEAARSAGVPVVHLQQSTLPGGRSDSPAWLAMKTRTFRHVPGSGQMPDYTLEGTWGWEIVRELAPREGEPVVRKFRSDGFMNTNLDHILRAMGIQSVVVVGEATHGCVEATVRGASFHDYYVVVVRDLVATYDQRLHEAGLKVMASRFETPEAAEVIRLWRQPNA